MMEKEKTSLRRGASWTYGVFLVITCLLDWVYLSGTAIEQVGYLAPVVWALTVGLMAISCYVFLEMAIMHKDKAGGMPTYVIEAYKKRCKFAGVVAMWGYVTSWGLAVGAIATFSGYFIQYFIPDFNIPIGAVIIVIGCYFINLQSIEFTSKIQSLIVPGIIASVAVLVGSWFSQPILTPSFSDISLFKSDNHPLITFAGTCLLILWSGYAIELVLTLVAEYKDPINDAKKAVAVSSAVFMIMTVFICASLIYLLPLETIIAEPFTPLLPLAEATFGQAFASVLCTLFIIGLILSVNACYVASSRVVHEASSMGYLPKGMSTINKNQSPSGALTFIAIVNVCLILSVGEAPLFMIVAGTIGYLGTVILANFAIYFMRKDYPDAVREFRVPDIMVPVSMGIGVINFILLVVGMMAYSTENIITGIGVLLLVIPLHLYRTQIEDKRTSKQMMNNVTSERNSS